MNGSLVLYKIEQAYNILLINVTGLTERTVSITYTITVGNVEAKLSVIIVPETDHVNTSICPGVSNIQYLCSGLEFSINVTTSLNFVANKFNDVTIPPLGPNEYCFITSL